MNPLFMPYSGTFMPQQLEVNLLSNPSQQPIQNSMNLFGESSNMSSQQDSNYIVNDLILREKNRCLAQIQLLQQNIFNHQQKQTELVCKGDYQTFQGIITLLEIEISSLNKQRQQLCDKIQNLESIRNLQQQINITQEPLQNHHLLQQQQQQQQQQLLLQQQQQQQLLLQQQPQLFQEQQQQVEQLPQETIVSEKLIAPRIHNPFRVVPQRKVQEQPAQSTLVQINASSEQLSKNSMQSSKNLFMSVKQEVKMEEKSQSKDQQFAEPLPVNLIRTTKSSSSLTQEDLQEMTSPSSEKETTMPQFVGTHQIPEEDQQSLRSESSQILNNNNNNSLICSKKIIQQTEMKRVERLRSIITEFLDQLDISTEKINQIAFDLTEEVARCGYITKNRSYESISAGIILHASRMVANPVSVKRMAKIAHLKEKILNRAFVYLKDHIAQLRLPQSNEEEMILFIESRLSINTDVKNLTFFLLRQAREQNLLLNQHPSCVAAALVKLAASILNHESQIKTKDLADSTNICDVPISKLHKQLFDARFELVAGNALSDMDFRSLLQLKFSDD